MDHLSLTKNSFPYWHLTDTIFASYFIGLATNFSPLAPLHLRPITSRMIEAPIAKNEDVEAGGVSTGCQTPRNSNKGSPTGAGLLAPNLEKDVTFNAQFEKRRKKMEEDFKSEDFDPTQCLFYNRIQSSLDDNLVHMQKMHGMFIPDRHRLIVDVETLTAYLHLIIFAYFQCLYCSTNRSSAQAVQQHMMGKGHCKFDIASEDSEFRDFYDFRSSRQDDKRWKRVLTNRSSRISPYNQTRILFASPRGRFSPIALPTNPAYSNNNNNLVPKPQIHDSSFFHSYLPKLSPVDPTHLPPLR